MTTMNILKIRGPFYKPVIIFIGAKLSKEPICYDLMSKFMVGNGKGTHCKTEKVGESEERHGQDYVRESKFIIYHGVLNAWQQFL
jgi:hypothetical protein